MAYLEGMCCAACQLLGPGLAGECGMHGMDGSATVDDAAKVGGTSTALIGSLATIPIVGAIGAAAAAVVILLNHVLNVGAGRKEADLITTVPSSGQSVQNTVGNFLATVNNQIPVASVTQLQALASDMYQVAQKLMSFVTSPLFKDGRASEQCLNTIMPLIDGSCGYRWAGTGVTMQPSQENCGPAGGGEQGTLGSIERQIQKLTGYATPYPQVMQGTGSSIASLRINQSASPIPQAGTLPGYQPNTPFGEYAGIQPVGGSGVPTSLLLGLAGFLFLRR
jgi:hypothetical protein